MANIKTIIFDLGGVLVKYNWMSYLNRRFKDPVIVEHVAEALFAHNYWDELDRGVVPYDEIRTTFASYQPDYAKYVMDAIDHAGDELTAFNYAMPWIKELKARGFQVLYLSNWSDHMRTTCGDALYFLPEMDGGVFSYEEKLIKPDAAIYNCILDRYNLKAEECVFFDDKKRNIDGACAVGIHGICFEDYAQAKSALEDLLNE